MTNKKANILSCVLILIILFFMLIYWGNRDTGANIQAIHETIQIDGLSKEYRIIFVADAHLSLCDKRDPLVLDKSDLRNKQMYNEANAYPEDYFDSIIDYVRTENPDLLILGGDILDSAMYASIDYLQKNLDTLENPYIYTLGNHDFEYGTEYFSENAYNIYLPRLGELTNVNDSYQIYQTQDFNILAINDDCSQIPTEALEALLVLQKEQKPIITVTHVPIQPIGDDTLTELTKQIWGSDEYGNSKVLMGFNSVTPNNTTVAFINEVCADNSLVCLNLSGHIHFYHKDVLGPVTTQIVTGAGYRGNLINITLTP